MSNFSFKYLYTKLSTSMEIHSIDLMRYSLAIVYIWFGALKLIGSSPAELLVIKTVFWLPSYFVIALGMWEVIMGLGLLIKQLIPYTIVSILIHMVCTLLPLFVIPIGPLGSFINFPFQLTLIGQYIIKNVVLTSGALVICGKYKVN